MNVWVTFCDQYYSLQGLPWSYIKRHPKTLKPILDVNGNLVWEGYCIDFVQKLSKKMNFDYILVPPKSGSFGERITNIKWDGLVGDLMTGVNIFEYNVKEFDYFLDGNFNSQDLDIAVSPMKMTAEREEVIDFVAPYYDTTGILIGTWPRCSKFKHQISPFPQ